MIDLLSHPEFASFSPELIEGPTGEPLAVRFDVNNLLKEKLGSSWQEDLCQAIDEHGQLVIRDGSHHTVREADPTTSFGLITVNGEKMAAVAPGLWELYKGSFKHMMRASIPAEQEPLTTYDVPLDALETVSQQRVTITEYDFQRRMEAHVDQRYTAVLVLAEPALETEGRLIIGNNPQANSVEEINQDAVRIAHKLGTLVCFSQGRKFPHYTEEINQPGSRRIIVSLNYPLTSERQDETISLREHTLGTATPG